MNTLKDVKLYLLDMDGTIYLDNDLNWPYGRKKEITKMVGFKSERNFYCILKKYEEENSNNEEL